MNEKGFWERYAKPTLNPSGRAAVAWKVQDAFRGGLPDVLGCWEGFGYLIEMKYVPTWPKRPTTSIAVDVTPTQRRHLMAWMEARGPAFVLLGVDRDWFLMHPWVPEKVTQGDLNGHTKAPNRPTWLVAAGSIRGGLLVGLREDLDFLVSLRTDDQR